MANVKWNVCAGTHVTGKGYDVNRDLRTEKDAKRFAELIASQHPEWKPPTIRKMAISDGWGEVFPGFQCWMEQKQYPWPAATG